MPNELKRLEQRAMFKGRRSFAIRDNKTVVASYSSAGRQTEVILNLPGINPNATSAKHVAVDRIVGACFFLLIALAFLWGSLTVRIGTDTFYTLFGVFAVCLIPVGLCWREYVRRSHDLLVFAEPMTGNQLLLLRKIPDKAAVDTFVAELQTAIKTAREEGVASSSGMLSHELERLAALRDKAVLSEPEFQKAKAALLGSLEEKPSIGFHS